MLECASIPPGRDHFNYDELDDCPCFLCRDVRVLAEGREAARKLQEGQIFLSTTAESTDWKRAMRAHLAASNKRDLFSECAFLFRNEIWSENFLGWLIAKIKDPDYRTAYWWVRDAELKNLASWVEDWYEDVTGLRRSLARILATTPA